MRQVTLAALDSFAKRVGAGYANPNRFAVALSGGPDSTALAHIFGEWHQQTRATAGDRIRPPKCIIVNHNLRKGSEREAQGVAEMARGMGLDPVLCSLDLKGEKRVSQQQARHGRLKAIFSACLREGVRTVLTGHTTNDQVETFILRTMRASGIRGLAGIPPLSILSTNSASSSQASEVSAQVHIRTLFDWQKIGSDHGGSCKALLPPKGGKDEDEALSSVYVFRPLLVGGVEKESAIDYCSRHGLAFVKDPSNENMNFTRNAIRRHFDTLNTRHPPHSSSHIDQCQYVGSIYHDVRVVQSAVSHASLEHDKRVASMLEAAVVERRVITKECNSPDLGEGEYKHLHYQVDMSELRKHPRLLVEDALLDLIHSMSLAERQNNVLSTTRAKRKKPRMKSIEKLYDTLLRGKKCAIHHVHCTPVPRTQGKIFAFECKF